MADLIWDIATQDDDVLSQLIGDYGLSRPAAMVMANRRTPLDEVESFLRPRLSNLSDPYLMLGIERAADRIWQAVRDREQIIIHGDYDVDGVTSPRYSPGFCAKAAPRYAVSFRTARKMAMA